MVDIVEIDESTQPCPEGVGCVENPDLGIFIRKYAWSQDNAG